jgi:NADPH-dependent 7-cyano-7-deazaguanine reductase QueF-like protein
MKTTGLNTDWLYGIEDEKFVLYINSATNKNHNFYEACMFRAKEIYNNTNNPVLGLSSGLDSQLVLHCLYSQGLKVDCVFRYYKGYNDFELNNLPILEKKYGFKTKIIEIDPDKIKDEIMLEYEETQIPPNQIIYKKFIQQLPDDLDILQGLDGPNIIKNKNTIYYLESYNSFEFTRRQAIDSLERKGKFVSFEKTSNILLSIIKEDIYQTFMHAYDYFSSAGAVKIIDYWDVYIKVYLYHKYWKNELHYFPKYQGPEGIDWIMNGPKNNYRNQMLLISMPTLTDALEHGSDYRKFTQSQYSG